MWASIIVAIVGAVGSMFSGIVQYRAAKQEADYYKKIGRYNQQQAEISAASARRAAEQERENAKQVRLDRNAAETEERKDSRRRMAAIENMYASSGVLIDGTSALDALAEQGKVDELNVLNKSRVSERQARQFDQAGGLLDEEAVRISDQGKLGLWEANVHKRMAVIKQKAAIVSGFGSVFGGASSVAGGISGKPNSYSQTKDGSSGGGYSKPQSNGGGYSNVFNY